MAFFPLKPVEQVKNEPVNYSLYNFANTLVDLKASLLAISKLFVMYNMTDLSFYNDQAYTAFEHLNNSSLTENQKAEQQTIVFQYAELLMNYEITALQNDLDINVFRSASSILLNIIETRTDSLMNMNDKSKQYFEQFKLNINDEMIDRLANEIFDLFRREINMSAYQMVQSHIMRFQSYRDVFEELQRDNSSQKWGDAAGYAGAGLLLAINPLLGAAAAAAKYFHGKNRDEKQNQRIDAYYREYGTVLDGIRNVMQFKDSIVNRIFKHLYEKFSNAYTEHDKQINQYCNDNHVNTEDVYKYLEDIEIKADEEMLQNSSNDDLEWIYSLTKYFIEAEPLPRTKERNIEHLKVLENRLNALT